MSQSVRVSLYIQPRASKTEIVGMHGDAVKVRLAAPPVDGEANIELEKFLSKLLKIPRANIEIVAGASSRRKIIEICTDSPSEVRKALGLV